MALTHINVFLFTLSRGRVSKSLKIAALGLITLNMSKSRLGVGFELASRPTRQLMVVVCR